MPTITASPKENPAGAPHALGIISPMLIQTGYGERSGQTPRAPGLDKPLGTVVAGGANHALLAKRTMACNYDGPGISLTAPARAVLAILAGTQQAGRRPSCNVARGLA